MYQKVEGEVCLMEIRATIVCCYNQKSIFNEMIRSLNEQSEKVKIIGINNSDGRFSSCSAAFNSVMDQIHTKYVIFSHQDIIYNTDDSLSRIIDYFGKIDLYDIVGVVGRSSLTKERIGNIKQGRDKRRAVSGKVEGIENVIPLMNAFLVVIRSALKGIHFQRNCAMDGICMQSKDAWQH